jgi:hypothetical protein
MKVSMIARLTRIKPGSSGKLKVPNQIAVGVEDADGW